MRGQEACYCWRMHGRPILAAGEALTWRRWRGAGEYAMLKAAAERGWLDEREAALEALLSLRRAGSDIILTYYATQAARWMAGEA